MRPVVVAWLGQWGVPGWVVPRYFALAALATFLGSLWTLRLARRDGARVDVTARALAAAYLGALLGGYLFEALRALPEAARAGDPAVLLGVGRAAYGGLIFGALGAVWVVRRAGQPVGAFLDRVAPGTGLVFVLVRAGCFLEGCDYGQVTAWPWGLRFPAGSLAALDHAGRAWIPLGAPSLPVHPTQLYEALVGAAGALVATRVLARGRRDGGAFAAFLMVYALGRFAIELLRGDPERGAWLGVSTAQWVSAALGVGVALWALSRRGPSVRPALLVAMVALSPSPAAAQPIDWTRAATAPPNPTAGPATPTPSATPTPLPTPSATPTPLPTTTPSATQPTSDVPRWLHPTRFAARLSLGGALVMGRAFVPHGTVWELFVGARVPTSPGTFLEFGIELRTMGNEAAQHNSAGVSVAHVRRFSPRFEGSAVVGMHSTAIGFAGGYFQDATAFGMRIEVGGQYRLGSRWAVGVSPAAMAFSFSDATGTIVTFEPRCWLGFAH